MSQNPQYYNVWCIPDSRWTNATVKGVGQDPFAPKPLTLQEAQALANKLNTIGVRDFEVRPLPPAQYYNIWNKTANRWIIDTYKGQYQHADNPFPLTWQEATDWFNTLPKHLQSTFEVRPMNSLPSTIAGINLGINAGTMPAINDHICPSCKNDRVSKSEASCWKCGGKL